MNVTRVYYAKQNKSARERYISYVIHDTYPMWNLRNKTDENRGKEEKEGKKRGRKTIRDF